jgi:hypothetical protein
VARADDPAALGRLRAGMRDRLRASELTDAALFGQRLTQALHDMWSHPATGNP